MENILDEIRQYQYQSLRPEERELICTSGDVMSFVEEFLSERLGMIKRPNPWALEYDKNNLAILYHNFNITIVSREPVFRFENVDGKITARYARTREKFTMNYKGDSRLSPCVYGHDGDPIYPERVVRNPMSEFREFIRSRMKSSQQKDPELLGQILESKLYSDDGETLNTRGEKMYEKITSSMY